MAKYMEFSDSEKACYSAGKAYALSDKNKRLPLTDGKLIESFKAGYKSGAKSAYSFPSRRVKYSRRRKGW